jgi:mRNA interferase YafQ
MPLLLLTTTAFEKDLRRVRKQGRDLDKLQRIVDLLQSQQTPPAHCRVHRLHGDWSGCWDCHVDPDWLLLYKTTATELILVRTGSHSELFR